MAVSATALTTLTNLKTALKITASDQDTFLEQCIDRASEWIEAKTERKLKARSFNGFGTAFDHKTTGSGDTVTSEDYLRFSGDDALTDESGRGIFHLPQFPILTVNSSLRTPIHHANAVTFVLEVIALRGSDVSGNETWDALTRYDDYLLDQESGILTLLSGPFAKGVSNYRVTCTAGLIGPTANTQPYVPADLEQCCIEVAKDLYSGDEAVLSESIGTWSKSYSGEQKMRRRFIHEALARYRRMRL